MVNYLQISDNFAKFVAWIGGSCKPSDKGKLTPFPRFTFCQHNFNNVSSMLKFEELPEVNSERWLSLEDLPDEVWKPYPLNNSYMVSNYSRVKSCVKKGYPYIMRCSKAQGYWRVAININNKPRCTKSIHRIMAETFIPNPLNLPQVNHRDENKEHNLLHNLEWCTNSYNMNYGTRNARAGVGISYANSIRIAQYSLEGKYIASYRGMNEASRILGFSVQRKPSQYKSQFSQCNGFIWRQYEEGVDMTKDIPPYVKIDGCRYGVDQYTLDGEYIATFASLKHASKYTGVKRASMKGCCIGNLSHAGGFFWKYVPMQYIRENLVFDINGRCIDKQKFKDDN